MHTFFSLKMVRVGPLLLAVLGFLVSCSQPSPQSSQAVVEAGRFAELIKQPNTVILDVRTAEEFSAGHIPDARLLDVLQEASFRTTVAMLDPSKHYLIYCRSGRRSQQAAAILNELGFKKVTDLKGGFLAWNGPVAK
jgi:rhodanese-related sulfurtransferase